MKATWVRLTAWTSGLSTALRWGLWVVLALAASALNATLPSPWSWVAVVPFLAVGVALFSAPERDRGA